MTGQAMEKQPRGTPYPDPLTISGPPSLRKGARTAAKREMGYEKDAPRCQNCRWYNSPRHVDPVAPIQKMAPHCRYGHFAVDPQGVCDCWEGVDGSVLEDASPTQIQPPKPPPVLTQKINIDGIAACLCMHCGRPFASKEAAEAHRKDMHPRPHERKRATTTPPI